MRKHFIALFATLLIPSIAFAQEPDIDVEFGYNDFTDPTELIFLTELTNAEGFQVVAGDFINLGTQVFTENPGFITEATEETGGIRVNPNDNISVRFLNAADTDFGAGFVSFYNPITGQLDDSASLLVSNEVPDSRAVGPTQIADLSGAVVPDNDLLLVDIGSDGTFESNAVDEDENQTLDAGQIHNHLTFQLDSADEDGAYGVLFQLESDFAIGDGPGDGVADLVSDPVFFIFNRNLSDDVFLNEALPAFGVGAAIPEPSTSVLLFAAAGAVSLQRRRRI